MESLSQINAQFSSNSLFDAFKLQLAKDFERSNFSSQFINDLPPDYTLILDKIISELHRAETKADANLMNLLYRIDISERQLKKQLRHHPNKNHLTNIAELIIKRVLQKVVIKKYYQQKESKAM